MFALNLSLLGHNTDVHFRVPRDKRKKICQHLGGKPLKFAGLPNHVRISINYASTHPRTRLHPDQICNQTQKQL